MNLKNRGDRSTAYRSANSQKQSKVVKSSQKQSKQPKQPKQSKIVKNSQKQSKIVKVVKVVKEVKVLLSRNLILSRNLRLKFILYSSFFDFYITCLRLETFDQTEVKIKYIFGDFLKILKNKLKCKTKFIGPSGRAYPSGQITQAFPGMQRNLGILRAKFGLLHTRVTFWILALARLR